MIDSKNSSSLWSFQRFLAICLLAFAALQTQAADLKVEAKLIWAANDRPTNHPNLKPVEGELAQKLTNVFKWKYYFEMTNQVVSVPPSGEKRATMSKKCDIIVKDLGRPRVEVQLIGEGRVVNKTTESLSKGKYIVIAGDDKNKCAWFVAMTQLEP